MKLGYFPGCSLHATGRELDESLRAIAKPLDLELDEVRDWACCGATSAHATNHLLSVALPARTLALAEAEKQAEVVAPCAACFNRLATAREEIGRDAGLANRVREVIGKPFANSVAVLNIVDVLARLVPVIKQKATRPLSGLKVACYYGCLLVRPPKVTNCDDPEMPQSMEEVVAATGATPVEWHKKIDCCGGGFSLARTGSVVRLGRAILEDVRPTGAQALVVACPMCQSNLDMRQRAMAERSAKPFNLPIIYITQLVGLALGFDAKTLGLGRHFVSTVSVATWTVAQPALPAQEGA